MGQITELDARRKIIDFEKARDCLKRKRGALEVLDEFVLSPFPPSMLYLSENTFLLGLILDEYNKFTGQTCDPQRILGNPSLPKPLDLIIAADCKALYEKEGSHEYDRWRYIGDVAFNLDTMWNGLTSPTEESHRRLRVPFRIH